MIVGKHVVYRGRVQGVGFRYTACQIAEEFDVAGFVRNLPRGDVEVAVEGETEVVEAFLAALSRRMGDYIRHSDVSDGVPAGHQRFQIRY
jgi:acylphosphatase